MPKPKPTLAWGIYGTRGNLKYGAFSSRKQAMNNKLRNEQVLRVRVTPVKKGKRHA